MSRPITVRIPPHDREGAIERMKAIVVRMPENLEVVITIDVVNVETRAARN